MIGAEAFVAPVPTVLRDPSGWYITVAMSVVYTVARPPMLVEFPFSFHLWGAFIAEKGGIGGEKSGLRALVGRQTQQASIFLLLERAWSSLGWEWGGGSGDGGAILERSYTVIVLIGISR